MLFALPQKACLKALKNELVASAITYIIFISVIVIVISPLLFSLSYHLLTVILGFVGKLSAATQRASNLPFALSRGETNPAEIKDNFRTFSIVAIVTISFFSSLIVSIVEKGDIKGGLKYIPFYIFGSIAFYFIFMKTLGALFGGIV